MKRIFISISVLFLGVFIWTQINQKISEENQSPKSEKSNPLSSLPIDTPSTETLESPVSSSQNELQAELKEIEDSLPRLQDLQNLTEEEVHHTPEVLLEGGKVVAEVLEKAELNGERREETLKFLLNCASHDEIPSQLRALCWNKATHAIPRWDIFIPLSEYQVPMEIQTLAEKIN